VAVRIWTSAERFNDQELCSILNLAIRSDEPEFLTPAVVISRALNMFCITRRVDNAITRWPSGPQVPPAQGQSDEADTTYRGGGLPTEHQAFFTPGKRFRSPMCVPDYHWPHACTSSLDCAAQFPRHMIAMCLLCVCYVIAW
jgi:hypothetical protein